MWEQLKFNVAFDWRGRWLVDMLNGEGKAVGAWEHRAILEGNKDHPYENFKDGTECFQCFTVL